jgi:DHA1 family tetracycline resistance protein-like MFS transporter
VPESFPRELRKALTARTTNPFSFIALLQDSKVNVRLLISFALSICAITAAQPVTILFTQFRFGWTVKQIGLYVTVAGLSAIVGQTILMRASVSRLGERRVLTLALLLRSTGWLLTAFVSEGWQMYAMVVFVMLGSVVQPMLLALISGATSAAGQGELQGALTSLAVAAEGVGTLAGAFVFGYFTGKNAIILLPGAGFILCSLVGIGTLLCLPRQQPAVSKTREPLMASVGASLISPEED